MLPALLRPFCPVGYSLDHEIEVKGLPGWKLRRCRNSQDLQRYWPGAQRSDDFWLRSTTLDFLINSPQGFGTEGIILTHGPSNREVLLTAQLFYFSALGQVKEEAKGTTSRWDLRRRLLSMFSFRALVLGQLLQSGDYSQEGLAELTMAESTELLPAVADTLAWQGRGIAGILLKDFFPSDHPSTTRLEAQGFHPVPTDPVMTMDLPAHWETIDDYLAELTSKYRVRYRRARTKAEGIVVRALATGEVLRRLERIYALYQITSTGATINLTPLNRDYFRWLAGVGDFTGYFNEAGTLVGFTTAIPNGSVLLAHYLGLEEAYKGSHHLYHNMLFDLLAAAIEGDYQRIDYGRTALEIKSSVGARPRSYAVHLRSRPKLINRLVPLFLPAVFTAPPWRPRNPFRAKTVQTN